MRSDVGGASLSCAVPEAAAAAAAGVEGVPAAAGPCAVGVAVTDGGDAIAGAAAAAALDKAGGDAEQALFEIAAAKLRTNKAIGQATSIAHQVHGAIGFTREYDLHKLTGPLLDWRSDHGNDAYWADLLGAMAADLGGVGLWHEVTRRG